MLKERLPLSLLELTQLTARRGPVLPDQRGSQTHFEQNCVTPIFFDLFAPFLRQLTTSLSHIYLSSQFRPGNWANQDKGYGG